VLERYSTGGGLAAALEYNNGVTMKLGDFELDTIVCGDCLELMKGLPDKSAICITDPPWGINVIGSIGGSKAFGSIGGSNIMEVNKYKPIINDDKKLNLSEIFLVSREQIIFGGNCFNFPLSRGWIVWDKKMRNEWNDNFSDGELAWTSFDRPLKIYRYLYMGLVKEGREQPRVHPTQKPIELIEWIIRDYTEPFDIILDPFIGSGTTAVAAIRTGRHFLGFEISPEYCAIANKRIKNELMQTKLAL
jgi:DNA modification methylase